MITEKIEGVHVNLRIADKEDSEFTLQIRQEEKNTMYMPKVEGTLEQQEKWILQQRDSSDCYFFVVERKNGEKIGTFSLYNIKGDTAESGRLILNGNQIESLETLVLFHEFAYLKAGILHIEAEIDVENNSALGLSMRLGGKVIDTVTDKKTGQKMACIDASKESFLEVQPKLRSLLERFAERV